MLKKNWLCEIPYILLGLMTVLFLSAHTPNVDYDALSYIQFSPDRPFIYPTFIWLFRWAGKYQFQWVIWAQSFFTFSALLYARYWLKEKLYIADFLIFTIFIFVLITICFHFQMWYIESEGLAFPFFVFTFFILVECFKKFNLKKIFYLSLLVSILILIRLQFYYFYGFFLLLLIWYFWKKIPLKSCILCMLIFTGAILLTTFVDKAYHYFKHGFFSGAPYSGLILSIQPFYLADKNAANYFENSKEKTIVQHVISQVSQKKLNRDAILLTSLTTQYYEYAYEEYNRNYVAIQGIIGNIFSKMPSLDENRITNNIAKTLFFHETRKNLYFYSWKVIDSMGGVPLFLFFCLLLFAIIVKIFIDKNWSPNFPQIFVALTIVITFLNAMLVSTVEPDCPPYFCYTQFLFYCLAALIADRFLSKMQKNGENTPS